MTEAQLLPAWSYDLRAVLSTLDALLAQCREIASLEEKLAEVSLLCHWQCDWTLSVWYFLSVKYIVT